MITDDKGFRLAMKQLQETYAALASLRREHPNASASWLSVLAEGFIDHAQQLRQEIEIYTGVADVEEARAELWLAIKGRRIGEGVGPASILTSLLDAFRKGVQSVTELLVAGKLAWRPTTALKDACDWQVVALCPGSLRIGIRLPEMPEQLQLAKEGGGPDVRAAVRYFLDVAAWAASNEPPETLARQIPDPEKRRLLLNAVKPFAPRKRGDVESVTVTGRTAPKQGILLTRAAPQHIDRAIDSTMAEKVEDHTGDLREIDLDNLTMIIRNAGDVQEVRCNLDESLLETAKGALDRRVTVSGVAAMDAAEGISQPCTFSALMFTMSREARKLLAHQIKPSPTA